MGGMSSCNEKWEVPNEDKSKTEEGTGMLSTKDLVLDVINAEQIRESRASEDFSNYLVSIINKTTDKVDTTWTYSEMPGLPVLKVGEYTIKVESGELQRAAWDSPYFVGEKDFTIIKDQITNIGTVTCKLQNLKVTVIFDDELRAAAADDVQCEIQTVSEGTEDAYLTYTLNEKRDGYFELLPGNTTMIAKFTGTVNGYKETVVESFTEIKPGQHYIITFKLHTGEYEIPDATGTMNFGNLNIDMAVTGHDMTQSVGGEEGNITSDRKPGHEEWPDEPTPPGPVDPDDPTPGKEAATFVCPDGALDLEGVNPVTVTSAVVRINCPEGVKNLNVEIKSTNANFLASAGELMPLKFDLANPGDAGTGLASVGLPVGDQVTGKTEVDFVITELVPLLKAFPGKHEFSLEVVDTKGNKSSLVLKFEA